MSVVWFKTDIGHLPNPKPVAAFALRLTGLGVGP